MISEYVFISETTSQFVIGKFDGIDLMIDYGGGYGLKLGFLLPSNAELGDLFINGFRLINLGLL